MFLRWPRFATPSSMMRLMIVCRAWSLPETLNQEPMFSPQLPQVWPHLLTILSETLLPSELSCPMNPFTDMSIAWSSAARLSPSLSCMGQSGSWLSRKLQASFQAPIPQFVLQFIPGYRGRVLLSVNLAISSETYFAKAFGLVLAQFMYFNKSSIGIAEVIDAKCCSLREQPSCANTNSAVRNIVIAFICIINSVSKKSIQILQIFEIMGLLINKFLIIYFNISSETISRLLKTDDILEILIPVSVIAPESKIETVCLMSFLML